MIRTLFISIFIIQFNLLLSQNNIESDKILKIENLKFNNNELRIYKKYEISTGLEMFRFYQDEKQNWKAELYNTIASKNSENKIAIRIKRSKLNSLKNFELIWSQILDTDAIHLPKMQHFQYKLNQKNRDYQIEEGEIVSSVSQTSVIDGISYFVVIKSNERQNQFEYDNPESYLKYYPNVDELLSFQELLNLIGIEFKIFLHK